MPIAQAQTPPRNATGYTRYVEAYQGDIPDTDTVESASVLTVRDAMIYVIPWNVSRIYLHVPEGADMRYFFDVHTGIANYGVSQYEGWYYWEFMPGTNRNLTSSFSHANDTMFSMGDFDATSVNVTGDQIKLQDGTDAGVFTSIPVTMSMAVNVPGIKVTVNGTHIDNVSIQISNDNGTTWTSAVDGEFEQMSSKGADIKYRLTINGNATIRPVIDKVKVDFNYTPASNSVALMAEYTITSDDNPPRFEMDKTLLYGISPAFVIVYTEEGFEADVRSDSTGIDWLDHFETDLSIYQREGKDLAGVGTVEPGGSFHLAVKKEAGPGLFTTQNIIYLAMALLILIGVFFVYKGMKDRKLTKDSEDDEDVEDEQEEDVEESIETPKDELLARKEKVLKAIKKLDRDFEENVISEEIYTELKGKYKKEAISIMKELDKRP